MATRGPERNVTDEQLIRAVTEALDDVKGPVVSTGEISARIDMSGTRIRERVKGIEEIKVGQIGGGPMVYWLED